MKRFYLFLLGILIFPHCVNAQYQWTYEGHFGCSAYIGEMGINHKDYYIGAKDKELNCSYGFSVQKKILFLSKILSGRVSWRSSIFFSRISGSDHYSHILQRHDRYLDFSNDLVELNTQLLLTVFDQPDLGHNYRYRNSIKLYIGIGPGIVFSNPKANYQGQSVSLKKLQTEGVSYSSTQFEIPFTTGIKFTHRRKYSLGFNFTWHYMFTDYLDDVSSTYADPSTLSSPLAAALSNRSNENEYVSPYISNFSTGNKRGDDRRHDAYLNIMTTAGYSLRGRTRFYRNAVPKHPPVKRDKPDVIF